MTNRQTRHNAKVGGAESYVSSSGHAAQWSPEGLEDIVKSDNIVVSTNHSRNQGVITFSLNAEVPRARQDKNYSPDHFMNTTRYSLGHGIIYPDGSIDKQAHPKWAHDPGFLDERAIKHILSNHLNSFISHPRTGEQMTVAQYHGLQSEIQESWSKKYKKSIDCKNPKGFSQRAHCQGRKKKLHEDLRRWFKEKWTAQDGSECGDYKGRGRVKCRPSRRVSEKSPQTWGEMSKEEKKKAVRKKQEAHRKGKQWSSHKSGKTWDGPKNKYKPGKKKLSESFLIEDDVIGTGENPAEYRRRLLARIQSGDISGMDHHDRVHGALAYIDSIRDKYEGPNKNINLVVLALGDKRGKIGYKVHGIGGSGKHLITTPMAMGSAHKKQEETPIKNVSGLQLSSYPNLKPEHRETLRRLMDFRGILEMKEYIKQLFLEKKLNKKQSDCGCDKDLQEEKKPYKGFKKGKNHPEGGLSRAEARRQGIHAGIETKDEAKRKGGFGKLSSKTQKRRKSFCARMCGMKRRNTSSKTARDPKSKINAALRVWGCRCGTNESTEYTNNILSEANKPTNPKLWSRAKALARKKFDVYPSAYANGWAAKWYKKHGGGWKKSIKEALMHRLFSEEVVNPENKGSMTPKEIKLRDRIAKNAKNIVAIKKGDTDKNARFRYATFVVLGRREKEGRNKNETPKSKKRKKKKSK